MFYASYGSFVHKLLEQYYNNKIKKDDLVTAFVTGFSDSVLGDRPSDKIVESYIQAGIDYFRNFEPIPLTPVQGGIEKRVNFKIGGYPFVGIIDFLGKDNSGFYIVDHKSRNLKPRSKRKNPTVKDTELNDMLRQLYIYSEFVKQEFNAIPMGLWFNCFKNKMLIKEQFYADKFDEAIKWALDTIKEIETTTDFYPNIDYFACNFLCGVNNECCYCQSVFKKGGM